jgi:hypothetical protein
LRFTTTPPVFFFRRARKEKADELNRGNEAESGKEAKQTTHTVPTNDISGIFFTVKNFLTYVFS